MKESKKRSVRWTENAITKIVLIINYHALISSKLISVVVITIIKVTINYKNILLI